MIFSYATDITLLIEARDSFLRNSIFHAFHLACQKIVGNSQVNMIHMYKHSMGDKVLFL